MAHPRSLHPPLVQIALKEIKEGVLGRKVLLGALFFSILLATCAIVRTNNHREEVRDYHERIQAQESFLSRYAHYRRISAMAQPIVPPGRMEPLVEAVVKERELVSEESFDENPLTDLYPRFDLLFLLATVGSLLAILMSHDSISSERESGTLPLLTSYAVERRQIFLGKLLGGVVSLGIYLALAMAAAVSIASLPREWSWGFGEWTSVALLFAVAWLYLSVHCGMGLMISSLSRSSASAAVACLVVWAFMSLILPNLGPYAANTLLEPPPVYEVEKRIQDLLQKEREDDLRQAREEYARQGLTEAQAWSEGRLEAINKRYFDRAQALKEDLDTRLARQTTVARNISSLAPYACFLYAGTELAGVGLSRQQALGRQFVIWQDQAVAYIEAKVRRLQAADASFRYDDFIDVSDGPRFHYTEPPISLRLQLAAPFIVLLGMFLAAFSLAGLVAFSRSRVV